MSKIISYPELFELIPQRFPALLVDRIEVCDEAGKYLALKNVTVNEHYFVGHFPDNPIMPGVLQLAAVAQAAGAAFKLEGGTGTPWVRKIKKMRFKNPVLPGDQLIIDLTITDVTEKSAEINAIARNAHGKVCSIVTLTLGTLECTPFVPTELCPVPLPEFAEYKEKVMDTNAISASIPHRFPFQFIDNVIYMEDMHIVGEKLVSINEPYSQNYIPPSPVLPVSVLTETCAQLGCVYMLAQPENKNKIGLFVSIEDAEFFRPAVPGDLLTIDFRLAFLKSRLGRGVCKVYCGSEIICELTMAFALVDKEA
ncbi:3-hydroxyacyl-ACP dehydratase FabZ [Lentisphaera profundi]|uniref:3-hydroxyacyl-ACP dehydratase FabZ n=1 Tax=Lentisphaera profundi TaxID=1658616 RepID=A0ABY7W086_9BACT|nr:3-hydroxyacyl-ACP dehydratase FabZ [Lentisphaera profundi]WDE98394.1 3-hydroxyacyl-ACP dehydratase FabZ [Lentisphaera profundi]